MFEPATITPLGRELQTAEGVARRVGELALSHFAHRGIGAEEKAFLDVVTAADLEGEALAVVELKRSFPNDAVVGEEGARTEAASGRIWYVDPVDGTFNFSRRLPYWCVSIGLVEDDVPILGSVFDPVHNEMFTAVRGAGAYLNGEPIAVSGVSDPMAATVQITVNFHRDVIDRSIADINAIARNVMRVRNLGALALEFSYVACGRLDAVVQRGSHPWDYAAASLIAAEAGAVFSCPDGEPFSIRSSDVLVASSSTLHSALLHMLSPGG